MTTPLENLEAIRWNPLNDWYIVSQAAECREQSNGGPEQQTSPEEKGASIPADFGKFEGENLQPVYIPPLFFRAIDTIRNRKKPKWIPESRWEAILQRLDVLVHEERDHFIRMINFGWPLEELLACNKFAPDARTDSMGLLMLMTMANLTIVKVCPRKAVLRSQGGRMVFYSLGVINRNPCECSTLIEIE
jgi:hypothetical protein